MIINYKGIFNLGALLELILIKGIQFNWYLLETRCSMLIYGHWYSIGHVFNRYLLIDDENQIPDTKNINDIYWTLSYRTFSSHLCIGCPQISNWKCETHFAKFNRYTVYCNNIVSSVQFEPSSVNDNTNNSPHLLNFIVPKQFVLFFFTIFCHDFKLTSN